MTRPTFRAALVLATIALSTTLLISCSRTGDGVPLAGPDTGSPVNCVKSIVEYEKNLLYWFADNQIRHQHEVLADDERKLAFYYAPTTDEDDESEYAEYRNVKSSIELRRALVAWFEKGENRQKLKDSYKLIKEAELVEPPERDEDATSWTEVSPETNQTVLVAVEFSWPALKGNAGQGDDPIDVGDFELKKLESQNAARSTVPVIGRLLHPGRYHVDVQRVAGAWRIADWRKAPEPEPDPDNQPD